MGCIGHGFGAGGYNDGGGRGQDRLRGEDGRFQAAGADFVDGCCDGVGGEAGGEDDLTGWVLAETVIACQLFKIWSGREVVN